MDPIITTYCPGWPGSLEIIANVISEPEIKEINWMIFGEDAP
jgi:hypothetical protein